MQKRTSNTLESFCIGILMKCFVVDTSGIYFFKRALIVATLCGCNTLFSVFEWSLSWRSAGGTATTSILCGGCLSPFGDASRRGGDGFGGFREFFVVGVGAVHIY